MKLKFLFSFVLCTNLMYVSAQGINNANYSLKEYQTFAKIHKYTLDNPFDIVSATRKHLKKVTISEKRISEILKAQFSGQKVTISKSEVKQLEKLQRLLENDQNAHTKKIDRFITSNKMTPSKYKEIRNNYSKIDKVRNEVHKLSSSN